jgi:hypothetical protein
MPSNRFLQQQDGDDVDIWAVLPTLVRPVRRAAGRLASIRSCPARRQERLVVHVPRRRHPWLRADRAAVRPADVPLWNALEGIPGTLYGQVSPGTTRTTSSQPAAARRVRPGLPGRAHPDRERASNRSDGSTLGPLRHRPPPYGPTMVRRILGDASARLPPARSSPAPRAASRRRHAVLVAPVVARRRTAAKIEAAACGRCN